ncbi:hypothetical protein SDC9_109547 [bioreactor metagenome]|uniref:Uncharacterized protein n=1 Tax=bioreactor metagenome TaxID=1076179 RepID=A0A645BB34_9ZZZZ
MLGRRKHGHIHANFRENGDSRKQLDTRYGHDQFILGTELFSKTKNKGIQLSPAKRKIVQVAADNLQLFSLFGVHHAIHSFLNDLDRGFRPAIDKRSHIKGAA